FMTPLFPHFSVVPSLLAQFPPLSLHDALPILSIHRSVIFETLSISSRFIRCTACFPITPRTGPFGPPITTRCPTSTWESHPPMRSEEHTSELQSRVELVCHLQLEKKKRKDKQR